MQNTVILPVEFERPVRRSADSEFCVVGFEFLDSDGKRSGNAVLCKDFEEQALARDILTPVRRIIWPTVAAFGKPKSEVSGGPESSALYVQVCASC